MESNVPYMKWWVNRGCMCSSEQVEVPKPDKMYTNWLTVFVSEIFHSLHNYETVIYRCVCKLMIRKYDITVTIAKNI